MCFGDIVHCRHHPNCLATKWVVSATCDAYNGRNICNLQFLTGARFYSARWLCKNCLVAVKLALVDRYINENEEELGLRPGVATQALRSEIRAAMMEDIADVPLERVLVRLEQFLGYLATDWEAEQRERAEEEEEEEEEEED